MDFWVPYGGEHFSKHRSVTSASIFDISAFRSMLSLWKCYWFYRDCNLRFRHYRPQDLPLWFFKKTILLTFLDENWGWPMISGFACISISKAKANTFTWMCMQHSAWDGPIFAPGAGRHNSRRQSFPAVQPGARLRSVLLLYFYTFAFLLWFAWVAPLVPTPLRVALWTFCLSARAVCALVENLVRMCPLPIQALSPGHPVRARVDCLATMMPHQPAGIDLLSLTALRVAKVYAKKHDEH